MAARRSRSQNIIALENPLKKVVAVMQRDEFRTTWVANKAIYRTRMAMADGGELLVIAPGVARFGEQAEVDALIRRYGDRGTERVLQLYRKSPDLQDLAHGAAHLIHGSSEGRFTIIYAPGRLARSEIEGVHYQFANLDQVLNRYSPEKMHEGVNTLPDGEEIFFIGNTVCGALGGAGASPCRRRRIADHRRESPPGRLRKPQDIFRFPRSGLRNWVSETKV